jgi:hypothetical protein
MTSMGQYIQSKPTIIIEHAFQLQSSGMAWVDEIHLLMCHIIPLVV